MSLPRYPAYKDSGVSWLGEVPAHWEVKPLKYLASFSGGGTPSRDNLEYWDGEIPWVSPKDMKQEKITDAEERITELGVLESSTSLQKTGQALLVVRSGILKHTIPVAINDVPVALNQDMKALDFGDYFISRFFLRWVQGHNDQLLNFWLKQGATVESIEYQYLAETKFPLPPQNEVTEITEFLDRETAKIDALIAEQEKLIALLAEKRQATISRAVTRGLDPNVPLKDSGVPWLGKVPAHWKACPLRYLAKVGNGSTPNRDNSAYWAETGFPWLNSSVVNQDEVTESDQFVTDLALKECHLPVVTPPAVLMGITGQGKTRGMVAKLGFVATVNQHLAYVKPDAEILNDDFLLRVFESAYEYLRTESDGAGSTKGAITCDQVSRLHIPLPEIAEQVQIAAYLNKVTQRFDSLKDEALTAVALLKERRAALISAAVTGKIDVRGLAA